MMDVHPKLPFCCIQLNWNSDEATEFAGLVTDIIYTASEDMQLNVTQAYMTIHMYNAALQQNTWIRAKQLTILKLESKRACSINFGFQATVYLTSLIRRVLANSMLHRLRHWDLTNICSTHIHASILQKESILWKAGLLRNILIS